MRLFAHISLIRNFVCAEPYSVTVCRMRVRRYSLKKGIFSLSRKNSPRARARMRHLATLRIWQPQTRSMSILAGCV